jgi:hypothetical protein
MIEQPSNLEILHSFMLWYQEKNGRAASLATIVERLPFWTNRSTVKHHIMTLAADGLVQKSLLTGPTGHRQWWAIEPTDE